MNILVCDDSKIARKSIIGRIDPSANLTIHQAEHGRAALDIMLEHNIDLLFLDLTMPVMDGFEVLASMPVKDYFTHTVVVSGDVQQEAKSRCADLGALDFIEKPFVTSDLAALFDKFNLPLRHIEARPTTQQGKAIDLFAAIKEMSNVALGSSASIIAQQMGRFIEMPLPNVATLHQSELTMTVQDIVNNADSRAVSQRFVGNGINGEALVCLHGSGFEAITQSDENKFNSSVNETILDTSNILVSSFLNSFSKQLDISISLRQPIVLEKELLQVSLGCEHFLKGYEQEIFTIEFVYKAENLDIACDIIFLMDFESLNAIEDILESVL